MPTIQTAFSTASDCVGVSLEANSNYFDERRRILSVSMYKYWAVCSGALVTVDS